MRYHKLAARLAAFLVLAVWIGPVGLAQGDQPAPAAHKAAYVRLVIDYGDGVEKHFTKLPYRDGMVVFDMLRQAQQHARGIQLEYRGSKATLFVLRIDNLKNEGRGRNWIYSVNGHQPDRSCGIQPVKSGDTVLWRFGKYR